MAPAPEAAASAAAAEEGEDAELAGLLEQLGIGSEDPPAPGASLPTGRKHSTQASELRECGAECPSFEQQSFLAGAPGQPPAQQQQQQAAPPQSELCCLVCEDGPRQAAILPCGHVCACLPCMRALVEHAEAAGQRPLCPYCRAEMAQWVQVFFSM